ncbi:hypothetical protein D3C87_1028780 [compost metagenome]
MTAQVTDTELLKAINEVVAGSPTNRLSNIIAMVDHMKRHPEASGTLSDAMTSHCVDNLEWVIIGKCSDSDLTLHANNLIRAYFFAHLRRRELVYQHEDKTKVTMGIEMVSTKHKKDIAFYRISSIGPDALPGELEYHMFPTWKFQMGVARRCRDASPNKRTAFGLASPHDAVDDNIQLAEPRVRRVVGDD